MELHQIKKPVLPNGPIVIDEILSKSKREKWSKLLWKKLTRLPRITHIHCEELHTALKIPLALRCHWMKWDAMK